MKSTEEYKVELDVFEGPLDLLLYLIKKNEVDIYDIPIERITGQYMEYMSLMRMLDLNIAGEFIVMAATLMMIKSRMLLPVEERPEDEETEEIDPRWDLVRQLVEYKKFKDVAGELQAKEYYRENVFDLSSENVAVEEESGLDMGEIGIFDLISAFKEVLARARPEEIGEIAAERYTTADKVVHILKRLEKTGSLLFTDLFGAQASRHEIVCTFLALLELIRLSQVRVRQDRHFDAIAIFAQDADGEEAS